MNNKFSQLDTEAKNIESILKSVVKFGYSASEKSIKEFLKYNQLTYEDYNTLFDLVDNYKQARSLIISMEKTGFTIEKRLLIRLFWKPILSVNDQKAAINIYKKCFSEKVFEERLNNPVMIYYELKLKQDRISELKLRFFPLNLNMSHGSEGILKRKGSEGYYRSRLIRQEAMRDANYKCEIETSHVTFLNRNNERFVESHHLIPLEFQPKFVNSLDIKENIVALCPNCHRKMHYGQFPDVWPLINDLYKSRHEKLMKMELNISLDDLKEIYRRGFIDDGGMTANEFNHD